MTTAPDGSPVELYARLPAFGEPELVHAAIPPGAAILELGCGAGRMTHRLIELGHPVTAVDSSAEMLAHVRGAETVHADIADLDLGRRFACVLLASNLVNVGDRERAGFLQTCARHVAADGLVLIQRYDPAWAADPQPSVSTRDGLTTRVIDPRRHGRLLTATVEYELEGMTWRHGPFTSTILTDDELEWRMDVGGLRRDRWLDERRTWLAAVPLPDVSALYVEVRSAEPLVGDFRLAWDSSAAAGIPAHVTVLYPFLDPAELDAAVERALTEIAASIQPFDLRLERTDRFPGVLWLAPDPPEPFAALTDAVARRWPDHPPYEGAFDVVIHHLTIADLAPADVMDEIERTVGSGLPLAERITHLTLATRRSGTWSVHARLPLGAMR